MLMSYSQMSSDCELPVSKQLRNWQTDVNILKKVFQNSKYPVISEAFPQVKLTVFSIAHCVYFY